MPEMTEESWDSLLDMMSEGMVVPVIGTRLLVDADGASSLQAKVAAALLSAYKVPIPAGGLQPFRELNHAVTMLRHHGELWENPQRLYGDINREMQAVLKTARVPKPLLQLAEIIDFRLLVTLTPDDLMIRALYGANRAVNEVVHSPKLPTSEGSDLPAEWHKTGNVHLLYLFGKVRTTPLYAIHEEDVLEYAHNVISRGSHAPTAFMGALHDRNLLLIGCNFPEWLSRFMLRATRKGRLGDAKGGREWLVEPLGEADPFTGFLGNYSRETDVLTDIDPVHFVDQLHSHWLKRRGGQASGTNVPVRRADSAMFFISYSRTTDLNHAENLYEALKALGVAETEIWFDRESLEPGISFHQRIIDGIGNCRYMLPLVSHAATARDEAFVFREWREATERWKQMRRTYLMPLVVDTDCRPETYDEASVKEWINSKVNFSHAPEGVPNARLMESLRSVVRGARAGLAVHD